MTTALTFPLMMLALVAGTHGADCVWDKDTQYPTTYPPLVMDKQAWVSVAAKLEGSARIVTVAADAALVIGCPGTVIDALQEEVVEATCTGGTLLNIGGQAFEMSELGCTERPTESLQKDMGSCGDGGQHHAIGFQLPGYDFYQTVLVCFDPVLESNLYSFHLIRGAFITASDQNPSRPSFKSSTGFYSVSANNCYLQESQEALMAEILGDSSVIDVDSSHYFARGHMAPDNDFLTEQEADATYYYINAAPQWQSFNNGNWKELESNAQDLAAGRLRDLQVWTGAWQVLQLDDINSNPVDIYLGLTENEAVIPAPGVTWKVVYDPITNEGAAVVGVNNPYVPTFPPTLCTDVCSSLSWVTIDTGDLNAGATYCCTVQDLARAIPNAPDLGDATLLTG